RCWPASGRQYGNGKKQGSIPMSIPCTCPECGYHYRIAAELAGRSVRCPACRVRFRPRRPLSWIWFATQVLATPPMLFGALFLFFGWPGQVEPMVAGVFSCLASLVMLAAGKGLDLVVARARG